MPKEELTPIDSVRCQGEFRESPIFRLCIPAYTRCTEEPIWVAISIREGKFYGAMILFDKLMINY